MNISLPKLEETLWRVKPEKTVPDEEVNPYLLNVLLKRILAGEDVTYGEIDYSQFEADDLRTLSQYCDRREHIAFGLTQFVKTINTAEAFCCHSRAFC